MGDVKPVNELACSKKFALIRARREFAVETSPSPNWPRLGTVLGIPFWLLCGAALQVHCNRAGLTLALLHEFRQFSAVNPASAYHQGYRTAVAPSCLLHYFASFTLLASISN